MLLYYYVLRINVFYTFLGQLILNLDLMEIFTLSYPGFKFQLICLPLTLHLARYVTCQNLRVFYFYFFISTGKFIDFTSPYYEY